MQTEQESIVHTAIDDALRRLIAEPKTRELALDAIRQAIRPAAEEQTVRVLAWLHRHELDACVSRLEAQRYQFTDIRSDSPEAHRKTADIQRILLAFGFSVGPAGVDGYYGGPAGQPVRIGHDRGGALIRQAAPNQKLLDADPQFGATESWTRDAARRLQLFLGRIGLPGIRPDLIRNCIATSDGIFGAVTLAGVRGFLDDVMAHGPGLDRQVASLGG